MSQQNPDITTAVYQILIRGELDQHWAAWFDNFTICHVNGGTILTGSVPDQAALHGILSKIRDLGLFLVFVQLIS